MAKDDILDMVGSRGPKIDPTSYPQIKCDKCGHNVFKVGYVVYNIPGIAVGNGFEDMHYPLTVYICDKCGTIMKDYREEIEKIEQEKEEKPKSSLIL